MKNEFNTALKEIRKKKGITQEQLADAVGVSAQAVSKWEMNGYPDTSLLPAIADYLEVTIDELFGNPTDKADTLNEVIKYIREKPKEERLQYGMYICRAISLGLTNSEGYWGITDNAFNDPNLDLYSEYTSAEGFFQSRLCESLQYFLIMPEPKNGYDTVLKYDEEYVRLFRFLGKPDALRAMYYLAEMKGWVYVNVNALAKALDITPERSKEILDEMLELHIVACSSLSSERGEEQIYRSYLENDFVSFMTFCRTLLHLPCTFNNQHNSREGIQYFKNNTQNNKPEKEK